MDQKTKPPKPPLWLRLVMALLLGAAAWIAVLPLVPLVQETLGPATIAAGARVGDGETRFVTPPLGSISADTHASPVDIRLTLSEIDIAEVERTLQVDPSLSGLADAVGEEMSVLARRLFIQLMIAGAVAGALAAALLPRRELATIAGAAVGGCLAAVVAMVIVTATFDQNAFEEPRFTGALRRAPQVIAAVNRGVESLERLGSRYEDLSQRFVRVLALSASPSMDLQESAVSILHVSDIHSNPLGVEFVRRLSRAFEVDAVIDTGDLTSFGQPREAGLARAIEQIRVPYLFVPGNHDSPANRRSLDGFSGVRLLDGGLEQIEGVPVLGWADPTFTADNQISTEQGNALRSASADEVLQAVLEQRPRILAVHDIRLAERSVGEVDIILAGHTHERGVEERSGTKILTVGSAGATGLGSFLVESDIPYEAQILYLQPDGSLVVDYVSLSAFGHEFDVERRVFRAEGEDG